MTQLITRKEIFQSKKRIASEIIKIQQSFYDDELLQSYKDDNEEHLYWEMFDTVKAEPESYSTHHKIIGLNHSDIDTYTGLLTQQLHLLLSGAGIKELIILSHLKLDFFGNRENRFEPLVKSYKQLEKITGTTTYKEAFRFNIDSLGEWVNILFWISRCDPSVSDYIFLFDPTEKIQFFICKYGNIHFAEFDNEQFTAAKLNKLGWTIIEGQEFDNFSSDGKISGRQIK
ncbi:MAG TPA: hypothetical protein DHW64_03695 [Chitinophagaceae bacterium]|jgi:hypothetical protein|nr:hypothetical protein [Chitinophagaceae bacterium]